MAKYAYPAIFTQEEQGYSVLFPDIEGCFTCGSTLPEALEMAEDALCLMLYDHEEDGDPIPTPSDVKAVQSGTSEIVSLVCCDTMQYRRHFNNRAVKKTLSIPSYLNALAEQAGVNFSAVLQEALKQRLGVQ